MLPRQFKSLHCVLLFLVLSLSCLVLPARARGRVPELKVGIFLHKDAVVVRSTQGMELRNGITGQRLGRLRADQELRLDAVDDGIRLMGRRCVPNLVLQPTGGLLSVGQRCYRGSLEVAEDSFGKLNVINHIDVESYLFGVIKAEIPLTSPPEALKAQAVAARTFALRGRGGFVKQGFDLKATEQSQMYVGVGGEDPRAIDAVKATAGQVLMYEGQLVEAYFHACCGGRTENNEDVWPGTAQACLRSTRCPWCRPEYPRFEWEASYDFEEIAKQLQRFDWKVGRILHLEPEYSDTGRVKCVRVSSDRGNVVVPGNKFRIIVDRKRIRSLKFLIDEDPVQDAITAHMSDDPKSYEQELLMLAIIQGSLRSEGRKLRIVGRGYGHGVGMCQWGARGMARKGFDYQQILHHYYKGARIARGY